MGIIATAALLGMLYFARDILVPITLAFILSLLIAPLVRALRRFGIGQTWSVLAAVLMLSLSFGAFATVIGSQLVRMAANLPKYRENPGAQNRDIEWRYRGANRFPCRTGGPGVQA